MNLPPTDYAAHESVYRRKLEHGERVDWSPEQDLQMMWRITHEALLARGPIGRVLALGCGAGGLALLAATEGLSVLGVDISPTAIAIARQRARDLRTCDFLVANLADATPLPGPFDWVIDEHLLHCVVGTDRGRVLRKVHASLRPGGGFLVFTMCGERPRMCRPGMRYDVATRTVLVNRDGREIASRHFASADSILDELRAAGFLLQKCAIQPATQDPAAEMDENELIVECLRP